MPREFMHRLMYPMLAAWWLACTASEPIAFAPFPEDSPTPWRATEPSLTVEERLAFERARLVVADSARRALGQIRPGPMMEGADSEAARVDSASAVVVLGFVLRAADAEQPDGARSRASRRSAAREPARAGPVDINLATARELETLQGVGPAMSARIIAARPFGSVDELRRVRGIGPVILERLRPHIVVTGP